MESVKENKLQDEVASLFEMLAEYKKNAAWEDYNSEEGAKERRFLKIFILVGSLIAIVLAVLIFAPEFITNLSDNPRAVLQAILLLFYFLGAVILWNSWEAIKIAFTDQTQNLLTGIGRVAHAEVALFEKLDQYSPESINYVARRLELSSTQAQTATGLFVGALEKVGIIPGIIATSFALDKALTSAKLSGLEVVSIGIVLVYLMMMQLALAAIRLRRYSFVLEQYLGVRQSNAKSKT